MKWVTKVVSLRHLRVAHLAELGGDTTLCGFSAGDMVDRWHLEAYARGLTGHPPRFEVDALPLCRWCTEVSPSESLVSAGGAVQS